MKAGLYLVGTPIGNLADVTLRGLDVLRQVDLVLTEDTRRTGILFHKYEIRTPMMSCHKFNEASRSHVAAAKIRAGAAVALVVDSGMPGVSDPGARVVAACREQQLPVSVVPGPSAAMAALTASGFGGRGFVVEGFLERKAGARKRRLTELAGLALPVVIFESPYRLLQLMEEIEETMALRNVFVGREMTKAFEELLWGSPAEVRQAFQGRSVKGEIVVVVSGR